MVGATVTNPEEGSLENRISTMAGQALEGWRYRGLEGDVPAPGGGEMPAELAAGILSLEFLLHAWDFAQASGASLTVADELVDYVMEIAQKLVPGARGPAFADEKVATEDASALDRLAAYSGRTPHAA